jgi:hypothetical protein
MFARRGIKAMGNNNPYAPPKAAIGDLPGGTSSSFITLYWSGRGKLWKIYLGLAVRVQRRESRLGLRRTISGGDRVHQH